MVPLEFKVLEYSKDEAKVWTMCCRNIVGVECHSSKVNPAGYVLHAWMLKVAPVVTAGVKRRMRARCLSPRGQGEVTGR